MWDIIDMIQGCAGWVCYLQGGPDVERLELGTVESIVDRIMETIQNSTILIVVADRMLKQGLRFQD